MNVKLLKLLKMCLTKPIENVFDKTIKIAEQKKITEKAGGVIDSFKE